MTQLNVAEYLLAGKDPDRTVLLTYAREYTYADLHRAVAYITKLLGRFGATKGDRVLLLGVANSFEWIATYIGILAAGLICVPLSSNLTTDDLCEVVELTNALFAVVLSASFLSCVTKIPSIQPITPDEVNGWEACEAMQSKASVQTTDDDLAALMFTSGSTAKPRGVMVTHGNIVANTESIIRYLELRESDRMFAVLPFHYCFGTSLLHTHLRVGGSLVLEPTFMYPDRSLDRMLQSECSGFAGVPFHYQVLTRTPAFKRLRFPKLRYMQQAGGALPVACIRELRRALPDTKIFVMYGQTEATARLSYLPPEFLDAKPGSIGRGIPGVNLQVLNERGEEVAPGEVGEIVAEGKNISPGYWRDSAETKKNFRNGKLYTGDLATVDKDGFIYIVGREKDFLKIGGTRVSSAHIEQLMLECDDVLEVAVVSMPDVLLGEAVRAFVVPRYSEVDIEASVRAFCGKQLPPQLVPREIIAMRALPRNDGGKTSRSALKRLFP